MPSARNICVPICCRGDTGARTRELLRKYLDLRIAFYEESDTRIAAEIGQQTASVQDALWVVVSPAAASHPTPTTALAISGMNDVLNSQGYTKAAW
ncbi:phage gp29-like protein [Bradyrhizobium sp. AZCC 2289]